MLRTAQRGSTKDNRYLTVFLRVSLTVIPTSWPSAIKKSISRFDFPYSSYFHGSYQISVRAAGSQQQIRL